MACLLLKSQDRWLLYSPLTPQFCDLNERWLLRPPLAPLSLKLLDSRLSSPTTTSLTQIARQGLLHPLPSLLFHNFNERWLLHPPPPPSLKLQDRQLLHLPPSSLFHNLNEGWLLHPPLTPLSLKLQDSRLSSSTTTSLTQIVRWELLHSPLFPCLAIWASNGFCIYYQPLHCSNCEMEGFFTYTTFCSRDLGDRGLYICNLYYFSAINSLKFTVSWSLTAMRLVKTSQWPVLTITGSRPVL